MDVSEVLAPDGLIFHQRKGKPYEVPSPEVPLADTHGHLTVLRHRPAHVALVRAALAGVRLLVVPVDPTDDVQDVDAFSSWLEDTIEQACGVLAELAQAGVMPPAFPDFPEAPELVDNVWLVAGAHPYGAERLMEDGEARSRLEALLDHPRTVGVGEFGVDFGPWSKLGQDIQERAFRYQLEVARERRLPVELHLRDADDDAMSAAHAIAERLLSEFEGELSGVDLHCFTSGPEVMEPFVELGCHIAFGGAMTFGRSEDIRAAALACPEHLLLSETDSPYMAPHPLRGQEAEPAMVALTVARLAGLRAEGATRGEREIRTALWQNACGFFGLGQ